MQIETHATSSNTAEGPEIVLRLRDQVRLVFKTVLVKNEKEPIACVRGEFVYQKKSKHDKWFPLADTPISAVKKGESYKLELHSEELLKLVRELSPLYRLVRREGVPKGKARYILAQGAIASFFDLE